MRITAVCLVQLDKISLMSGFWDCQGLRTKKKYQCLLILIWKSDALLINNNYYYFTRQPHQCPYKRKGGARSLGNVIMDVNSLMGDKEITIGGKSVSLEFYSGGGYKMNKFQFVFTTVEPCDTTMSLIQPIPYYNVLAILQYLLIKSYYVIVFSVFPDCHGHEGCHYKQHLYLVLYTLRMRGKVLSSEITNYNTPNNI